MPRGCVLSASADRTKHRMSRMRQDQELVKGLQVPLRCHSSVEQFWSASVKLALNFSVLFSSEISRLCYVEKGI